MPLLAWHELTMHRQLFNIHSIDILTYVDLSKYCAGLLKGSPYSKDACPALHRACILFLLPLTQRAVRLRFPALCVSSSTFAIPLLPLR